MDLDFVIDIVNVAKYAVIILGIVGLMMILVGRSRRQKPLMTQGAYVLVLSIVFGVCGYFIVKTTLKKADQKYEEVYYQYQNQYQQQK